MRILYESDLAGSKHHGMAYRIYQFASEFIKEGHEVMIVAASYSHVRRINPSVTKSITDENIDGIHYKWLKTPSYKGNGVGRVIHMFFYNFKLWKNAKKIAREFKPDIVISSGVTPLDFIGCNKIAKKSEAKILLEVGDLWPLTPIELGGYSKNHPFIKIMQWAENYSLRNTDGVISLLPCAENYMVEHGLKPNRFHYIPNGIISKDWECPSEIPEEHSLQINKLREDNRFIIGYAGTFSISNSLYTLLDVAKKFIASDIVFLLVGNGPIKEDLGNYITENKLDNVIILPPIPKPSIPSLLEKMDILYTGFQKQSLYRFGISPNKLYDYMMAGKPIIQAIEAGNNPVKDAMCGIAVEPDNVNAIVTAIKKLKNKTEKELNIMGQNGQQYILKYHTYDVLTQKYLEIIKEICK